MTFDKMKMAMALYKLNKIFCRNCKVQMTLHFQKERQKNKEIIDIGKSFSVDNLCKICKERLEKDQKLCKSLSEMQGQMEK